MTAVSDSIFLTSVDAIPYDEIMPMNEFDKNCGARAQGLEASGCTMIVIGRKQEKNESVAIIVSNFTPSITFRFPHEKRNTKVDSALGARIFAELRAHASAMVEEDDAEKIVRVGSSYHYTTNGYRPHEEDACRPQDFLFVSLYCSSLRTYKRLQSVATSVLHSRGSLPMGAIPVEVDFGPEQQFMDAIKVPPSGWFVCRGYVTRMWTSMRTTCDEEWTVNYSQKDAFEPIDIHPTKTPALTLMCYDIETNSVAGKFPKASDPFCEIKTIACRVVKSDEQVVEPDSACENALEGMCATIFVYVDCDLPTYLAGARVVRCNSELDLCLRFIDFITSSRCDVIVSYNGVSFDLPYIRQRVHYLTTWELRRASPPANQDKRVWSKRKYDARMRRLNMAGRLPLAGRSPRITVDQTKMRWTRGATNADEDDKDNDAVVSNAASAKRLKQTTLTIGDNHSSDHKQDELNDSSVDPYDMLGEGEDDYERDAKVHEPSLFQLIGVVDWDHLSYLQKGFKQYDDYKLNTVCQEELNVGKLEEIQPNDIFAILTNPTEPRMKTLLLYNLIDVTRPLQLLYKKYEVAFVQQLAFYTHTTVNDIVCRGQQHRLTQFFTKQAHLRNYRYEQMSRNEFCEKPWLYGHMEGATVLPTRRCHLRQDDEGQQQFGITCDFNSLYPSIQRSRNLSPEMHLRDDVDKTSNSPASLQPFIYSVVMREQDEPTVAYTHRVVQPDREKNTNVGLMPQMLEFLLSARKQAKKDMKAFAKGSYDYNRLDIVQNVLKVICNSIYGSLGAIMQFGRLSNRVLARIVTYNGRQMIGMAAKAFMMHENTCILAGDTDSVMALRKGLTLEQAVAHGHVVAEQINLMLMENGLVHSKIEFEKAMGNATFLAQKNYIYQKYEGYPEVGDETTMGLLNKKRGTAQIFKDAYSTIVRISLLDAQFVTAEQMRSLVLRVMRELFYTLENVPVQSFVKTQSLAAENSYKTPTAAVHAFRKLRAARGTPWPNGKQRVSIVTEFNPNPKAKVTENACILDHFLEKHARGEAKLDLMSYLSNVSNRFVALMKQLGIAGDIRMKKCVEAYKLYAAGNAGNINKLFATQWSKAPKKPMSIEWSDSDDDDDAMVEDVVRGDASERESHKPVQFSPMIVNAHPHPHHTDFDVWKVRKDCSRACDYEEYIEMKRLEAEACLKVKDELLEVNHPTMQAVMDKLNPDKMKYEDRKQQDECEKWFQSSLELPNSADMRKVVEWAHTGEIRDFFNKDVIEDIVLRLESTPFDSKRTTKNCWYDYPDDVLPKVEVLRESEAYQAKLKPVRNAALARLARRAVAFARS